MFFTSKLLNFYTRICIALLFCTFAVVAQQPATSSTAKEQKPSGTSMIRGRVIYADTGRPLRRAEVFLVSPDSDVMSAKSITDRNGEFTFYAISAGRYLLVAHAPDIVNHDIHFSRASLSLKIALGQIEDGFSEVTVDGRSSIKTEIRASRGGVITGRVITETDEPIAKALIKLFQVEENGRVRPASLTYRMTAEAKWMFETDSRGIYRIAGLPSGEYIVQASESDEGGNPDDAEEASYTNGSMMVAFHPNALKIQEATGVKVVLGSETRDVDIHFPEQIAHRISGTVTLKGQPVGWAEMQLLRDDSELEARRFDFGETRTDGDGRWEIRSVPDGNYTLWISGSVTVLTGDQREHWIVAPLRRKVVVEGSDVTNLKLDLVSGAMVRGVVSVEGGAKLPPGVFVELISTHPPSGKPLVQKTSDSSDLAGDVAGSSFVQDSGKFQVSGLHSGSFYFHLLNLGDKYYVKSITLNGKDALREPIKVDREKLLDGIRIVLSTELASLSGRAVEKDDRSKPLRDAVVLLFPIELARRRLLEGPITARTDKDGRFIVKGAPGEYFVFLLNRGQKEMPLALPTEASIVKNSSTQQKITLQPGDEKKIVEVTGPSQP